MKTNWKTIVLHVIACMAFLALPIFFSPDFSYFPQLFTVKPFQRNFITYILLLGFFYLNFYVLLPKLYFRKKYLAFGAAVLLCYLVVSYLPSLLISSHGLPPVPDGLQGIGLTQGGAHNGGGSMHHGMPGPGPEPGPDGNGHGLFMVASQHFFQFFIALIFTLLLKLNSRLKRTEKEKLSAELSYLKAQINPHFLFNTLNSIYSLAIVKSDDTPTAVVKLAGMMRYVLSESNNEFVSLEKEIEYITDYIDLQRIRLGDTLQLNYQVERDTIGKQIAPLILIPFIENAFKYGVNPEESSRILVSILIKDDTLTLHVDNKKVYTAADKSAAGGLGIENTRNRLSLLYPHKHTLTINDKGLNFILTLTINLK